MCSSRWSYIQTANTPYGKNSRCLKNVNINETFNVFYDTSQQGWPNGGTFKRYLRFLDNFARKEKTRFVFVCDNASSHVSAAKDMDPNGSQDTFFRLEHLDIYFFHQIVHPNANLVTWASFDHLSANFESFSYFDYSKFCMTKPGEKFKLEKIIDMAICLKMI